MNRYWHISCFGQMNRCFDGSSKLIGGENVSTLPFFHAPNIPTFRSCISKSRDMHHNGWMVSPVADEIRVRFPTVLQAPFITVYLGPLDGS